MIFLQTAAVKPRAIDVLVCTRKLLKREISQSEYMHLYGMSLFVSVKQLLLLLCYKASVAFLSVHPL